ncbi:hypothetical protein ASPWEDRAFT_358665 [Aspergillus wentii DTO 134E9]|uniref:Uncharacterized protein n=1 Tax=Aspergillus wentii DTO 134E9 TaxID=1073089 RepID=A0A1L9RW82_ASPWE|nr:uncharacterized protein ASPWEDRAFT_358665 [Aspergillus wentii DTO 134E9]OJJ39186.1 hypothetical protein ASPWEDRAFT_358665 [Aspergillus wentii DTO 134E9]
MHPSGSACSGGALRPVTPTPTPPGCAGNSPGSESQGSRSLWRGRLVGPSGTATPRPARLVTVSPGPPLSQYHRLHQKHSPAIRHMLAVSFPVRIFDPWAQVGRSGGLVLSSPLLFPICRVAHQSKHHTLC